MSDKAKAFSDDLPYLLLDIREKDDYDICHIIKGIYLLNYRNDIKTSLAFSYPYTMLSRSVNFETKEMLACRNKPGKIIIVYDGDESIG